VSRAAEQETYNELCFYTLAHGDPSFIHQHVVDAFTAQNANEHTKPIGLTFALVGLYLHVEKKFSGKQVQRTHMQLAAHKGPWPPFDLPRDRGEIRVADVMARAGQAGVPLRVLGTTGGDALTLGAERPILVKTLQQRFEDWLPAYMAGA